MDLKKQIGISTLTLAGFSLDNAITEVAKAGFKVVEITPRLFGNPEAFDAQERKRLRNLLKVFHMVTIHSSTIEGVDICSQNAEVRKHSIGRYLDLVDFSLDIGGRVLTFHPWAGHSLPNTSYKESAQYLIEFARLALERDEQGELLMGYEFFDEDILSEIGNSRFGMNFDIGHAVVKMERNYTEKVLPLIERNYERVVEFHIHGVMEDSQKQKVDHHSLELDNCLDYGQVMKLLKKRGYPGPLILEITRSNDVMKNLEGALNSRERLLILLS